MRRRRSLEKKEEEEEEEEGLREVYRPAIGEIRRKERKVGTNGEQTAMVSFHLSKLKKNYN